MRHYYTQAIMDIDWDNSCIQLQIDKSYIIVCISSQSATDIR